MWGVRSEAPTEQVSESLKRRMGKIGCEVGWDNGQGNRKKGQRKNYTTFFLFLLCFLFHNIIIIIILPV